MILPELCLGPVKIVSVAYFLSILQGLLDHLPQFLTLCFPMGNPLAVAVDASSTATPKEVKGVMRLPGLPSRVPQIGRTPDVEIGLQRVRAFCQGRLRPIPHLHIKPQERCGWV